MPKKKRQQDWKSAAAERLMQLTGHPSTIDEAIKRLAESFHDGVIEAPINLERIAWNMGASEVLPDLQQAEEVDEADEDLRFFELPTFLTADDRMDIALKLAHHYFAHLKPRGYTRGVELERLCFRLAAELLLPTDAFHKAVGETITMDDLMKIASAYDVSPRLVARRAMAYPYVVVFEHDNQEVLWSYGGLRQGLLQNLPPDFQGVLKYTRENEFIYPLRFFSPKWPWFGSRCVEWSSARPGRSLVLIRLPLREETVIELPPFT